MTAAAPGPAARRRAALDFLARHGAETTPHLFSPLGVHLRGTEALLRAWGATDELALAGLVHAAYGTAGFDEALIGVDRRDELVAAVGEAAEAVVYRYAACDRDDLYPQLEGDGPVVHRDRFTGDERRLAEGEVRDFVDLTLANEVELACAAPGGPAGWTWLLEFCDGAGRRATPAVRRAARALLSPLPTP